MGGRISLHAALAHPDQVTGLVLLGATPGIEDRVGRATRREEDEARAAELERDGVAAFLDHWLATPLLASLPLEAARVEDRLRNSAGGLAARPRLAGPRPPG